MLNLEDSTNHAAQQTVAPLVSPNPDARRLPAPERHVSVTPIDMRQARFASAMRGFDKTEVTAFLEEAASDYEHALRENDRLRQQIAVFEASLTQYRELEGSMKNMLISAQKVADDMRENAEKEAARLLREAEGRVQLMVQKAQARVEDSTREIDALKLKRREVQANIEACVSALQGTLDFVREQDQKEREHRVVPHRPAVEPATQSA
ncbi:MAG TPA: DivIVA domain-containing protein [Vicinamibacterales bacterium]